LGGFFVQRQQTKNKIDTSYLAGRSGKSVKNNEKSGSEGRGVSLQGERLSKRPLFEVAFSFLSGGRFFVSFVSRQKKGFASFSKKPNNSLHYRFLRFLPRPIKTINARNRRILHDIFFPVHALVDALAHQSCFVETAQNQFEFAWIGIHVAYGIDARDVGLVIEGVVYLDGVLFNLQSPIGNRAKFGCKPKKAG
jgi:hypothetical protein